MLKTDSVLMDSCEDHEKVVEEKQFYPIIIGSMQIYPVSRTIDSEESVKDAIVVVNGSDDIEQPLSSAGEEDNVCNNELIEVETLNDPSKQPLLSGGEEECVDNVSTKVEIVNGSSKQPLVGEETTITNSESTDVETMNGSNRQPLSHADEVESVSNNESIEVETMNGGSEIIEPVCHAIEQESASNGESTEVDEVMIGSSETASPSELGSVSDDALAEVEATNTSSKSETASPSELGSVSDDALAEVEATNTSSKSETASPSELGSVSNDALAEVEATNTSSKSETVEHAGELRGVSTLSNWGNKPNFTSARVVGNVRRQPIVRQSFPRDSDDKIGENIGFALLELDEMNRRRDALRMEVETKKIISNDYRDKYEVAKSVQSVAYDVLNAKRQELDSVQSTLNMIKNAVLVKETGDKVRAIQYRLEHETIYSIQEEKRLIREMKQLTAYHQELGSIVERQTEPQPLFDEKKPLEKELKALKEELDNAKKELSRIKLLTNAARKVYFDENEKLKEMQGQFKSANVFCQEAYANVRNLKSQMYKNKYFQMYKDDDFKNKYLRSNPTSTHALNAARRKVEDNKVVTPSASTEIKPALHSQEMVKEENKHSQEEEELPREEEVLPKEIFAVKSREEFVAEEKAKAKEAEERKKRNAEKAKDRADKMEQREAERKVKEKAKRDRRKARKAGIVEVELLVPISEDPSFEPPVKQKIPEIREKPTVTQELLEIKKKPWSKKSKKTSALAKTKIVSPPLPNKNKKPMQLWKWIILSTPLVVAAAVAILADPLHILL